MNIGILPSEMIGENTKERYSRKRERKLSLGCGTMRGDCGSETKELHIAFCFDEKLVRYVLVAAASCIRTAVVPHHFHFIYPDTAEKAFVEAFRTFEKWREGHPSFQVCRFSFVPVSSEMYRRLPSTPSLSKAAALRLLLDSFLPQLEKVLYLDSDLFVTDSLLPIWRTELGDTLVAAVEDGLIRPGRGGAPYLRKVRLSGPYFNSGVLLIDLAKWKDHSIGERAIAELRSDPIRCGFLDQDALNILLEGQWTRLADNWNLVLSSHPLASRWHDFFSWKGEPPEKGIYHFTGAGKPWSTLCYSRIRYAYRALAKEVFPDFSCISSPSSFQSILAWLPGAVYRMIRAVYQQHAFSPRGHS